MAGRPRRTLGVVCALLLAAAAPAHAAPQQQSIFMDDDLLLYRGDAVSDKTFDTLQSLGVTQVRLSVHWRAIAPDHRAAQRPASLQDPEDPRDYESKVFDTLDTAIRNADAHGISVLLNPTGGAPIWATDGNGKSLQDRPDATAYGQFVAMLGRRYDGTYKDENQFKQTLPRVRAWSIWNEPNAGAQLLPQREQTAPAVRARPASATRPAVKARRASFRMVAPRTYRTMAYAAIDGLHRSGHQADTVLLGETAPRGAALPSRSGGIRPVPFIAAVLCVDPETLKPLTGKAATDLGCSAFTRKGPLQVTGYAHHPYTITNAPTVEDPDLDDITLPDRDRLYRLLDAGAAAGRIPGGLPAWWTEFGWQTKPDPIRGVELTDQARWLAESEAITRADPRSAALTQFLLQDTPPRDEPGASLARIWGTYQTGLRFADGSDKPSLDAYRLPLAVLPGAAAPAAGAPTTLWGLIRPARGAATEVTLTWTPAGSDQATDVMTVPVKDPSGSYTAAVTPPGPGTYHARWTEPAPAGPAAADPPRQSVLPIPLPGSQPKPTPAPPPPPSHLSAAVTVP